MPQAAFDHLVAFTVAVISAAAAIGLLVLCKWLLFDDDHRPETPDS